MGIPPALSAALLDLQKFPYENLSKIVDFSDQKDPASALDTPDKFEKKARELGGGGTCYALTHFLHQNLKERGFWTQFLTAHNNHRRNIHCGLLWTQEEVSYLLDPGYMIFAPLEIPRGNLYRFYNFAPNKICLQNDSVRGCLRLHTGSKDQLKFRFEFPLEPLSESEFYQNWKDSFFLEMMEYPVLNRVIGETQHYLQKQNYMRRTAAGSEMTKVNPEMFSDLAQNIFGISPDLLEASRRVFLQKGRVFF